MSQEKKGHSPTCTPLLRGNTKDRGQQGYNPCVSTQSGQQIVHLVKERELN